MDTKDINAKHCLNTHNKMAWNDEDGFENVVWIRTMANYANKKTYNVRCGSICFSGLLL